MGKSNDKYVFIQSKEFEWYPCKLVSIDGMKAKVLYPEYKDETSIQCDAGRGAKKNKKELIVDLKDYQGNMLPMQNVDVNGNGVEYPDMVKFPFLHEAAILYNLKLRHMNSKPYTRTGDIIVAMNPFQWFTELYTEQKRVYYSDKLVWEKNDADIRSRIEPHVYETSSMSFKDLVYGQQDQSILVSGESGAGKTETVKIMMNHIASVQRGPDKGHSNTTDPVVNRVLMSNSLLEAFGNAKTLRNDNSSRFGKYCQLQFDNQNAKMAATLDDRSKSYCTLAGSKCEVYLLEKNRITGHEDGERTYHIFYQMIASPKANTFFNGLSGKTNEDYKCVGYTDTKTIEHKTDGEHFDIVLETLRLININGDNLKSMMRAICAVMHCGNLSFAPDSSDNDKSQCSTASELQILAELMGVTTKDLTLAFTERTMKTRNETYKVPLNAIRAKDSSDSFAKEIYGKLFLWLVKQINAVTSAEINYKNGNMSDYNFGIIGLLDIFGFEAFKINRFEQLCINYANEKLQQKFTEDIFRSVQEEYESEGIELAEIKYDDNTDVLDLIEGKTGLLALLNEECVRPKGAATGFVNKAMAMNMKKSPCMFENKLDSRLSFGIHHYAGKVMYTCDNFVTRNQDSLPTDLLECAEKSSNFIISKPSEGSKMTLKKFVVNKVIKPKRQKSNIISPTVWTKYRSQLANLMADLRTTNSRYVRCIKPNMLKKPVLMEHKATMEQLRCAGVIAAITLSRSAFPNQLPNETARYRFSTMWNKRAYPSSKSSSDSRDEAIRNDVDALMTCALRELIDSKTGKKAFVVGRTRTYFRQGALEFLETNRAAGMDDFAVVIQRIARGYIVKSKLGNSFKHREEEERKRREEEERRLLEEGKRVKETKRRASEERERVERKRLEEKARKDREKQKRKDKLAKLKQVKEEKDTLAREQAEAEKVIVGLKSQIQKLESTLEEKRRQQGKMVSAVLEEIEKEEKKLNKLKEKYLKVKEDQNTFTQKEIEAVVKKASESDKVVKFYKKENSRLLNDTQQKQSDFGRMRETNKRLIEASMTAGASVDTLNKQATALKDHNVKLEESVDDFKEANEKLERDLRSRKAYYEAETNVRNDYEIAMEEIVRIMIDECDDNELKKKIMEEQSTCMNNIILAGGDR